MKPLNLFMLLLDKSGEHKTQLVVALYMVLTF